MKNVVWFLAAALLLCPQLLAREKDKGQLVLGITASAVGLYLAVDGFSYSRSSRSGIEVPGAAREERGGYGGIGSSPSGPKSVSEGVLGVLIMGIGAYLLTDYYAQPQASFSAERNFFLRPAAGPAPGFKLIRYLR